MVLYLHDDTEDPYQWNLTYRDTPSIIFVFILASYALHDHVDDIFGHLMIEIAVFYI